MGVFGTSSEAAVSCAQIEYSESAKLSLFNMIPESDILGNVFSLHVLFLDLWRKGKEVLMKVSVIGLGYVGSVAAGGLASAGHDVLGVDIDAAKIRAYESGDLPAYEPGLYELINDGFQRGNLRFLTNDQVSEPLGEVVIIATGTPTTSTGAADLSFVHSSMSWIKEKQKVPMTVIVKSTVPPGTGVHFKETVLSESSLDYVSNPEFLREGSAVYDWFHPDRIVVGGNGHRPNIVNELFANINSTYVFTDITSAEMIKYAANAFLATKISFINEIANLCDRVGAIIDDLINKG